VTVESAERARKDRMEKLENKKKSLEQLLKEYEELSGEVTSFIKDACDFASGIRKLFEGTSSETGISILNYSKSLVKGHDNEHLKQIAEALENARRIVGNEIAAVKAELARLGVNIKL